MLYPLWNDVKLSSQILPNLSRVMKSSTVASTHIKPYKANFDCGKIWLIEIVLRLK